jgi:hypothetical protein
VLISQESGDGTAASRRKASLPAPSAHEHRSPRHGVHDQWRRIDALTSESGPFIRRASRTAMTSIALDWPAPVIARRAYPASDGADAA